MADKLVLEAEVKSNIGQVSKETKELTNNFGAFGITIGGIKDKFKDVAKIMNNGLKQVALQAQLAGIGFKKMFSGNIIGGAKTLFGVIKTGIAATGIGALLIAFTSLATFFTKTKKGAELLEVAFSGVGAAISVIVDRVSKFGGAIVKLFQGDAKGALQDVKGAFTGIGEEIANDTRQAIALKKAFQDLRDSERKLNVETAQRRAEIEALKLIAEDVTNSEQVRLKAAQDAFAIENKLLADRVANAEEAVRIQKEQNEINQSMDEDLDALAQKEIDLANIKAESTTKQIELNNKINSIQAEAAAKRLEELNVLKEARAERMGEMTEMPLLAEVEAQGIIQANNKVLDNFLTNNKIKKQDAKLLADAQKAMALDGLALVSQIAGEGSQIGKTAAVASATISGIEGVQNAFTTAQKSPITALLPAYPFIQAGLAGAFSAVQIQKILSGSPATGGGGGGTSAATPPATPAPQMMSGAFELTGGVEPEAMRAYVVTDEMTNSQNQLANIRRRATI